MSDGLIMMNPVAVMYEHDRQQRGELATHQSRSRSQLYTGDTKPHQHRLHRATTRGQISWEAGLVVAQHQEALDTVRGFSMLCRIRYCVESSECKIRQRIVSETLRPDSLSPSHHVS